MMNRANGRGCKAFLVVLVGTTVIALLILQHNLKNDLYEAQNKLNKVKEENSQLQRRVRDVHSEKSSVETDKFKVEQELMKMKADISKRENEARRNLAEIKNNHEKELTATISQSEKLQKELETCQSKNEEFQRQKDKEMNLIQEDLHNERIKAEECQADADQERKKLLNLQQDVSEAQQEVDELTENVNIYQQKNARLTSDISKAKVEIEKLKKLIKECNPEIELDKEPESLAGNSKKQEKMEHSKEEEKPLDSRSTVSKQTPVQTNKTNDKSEDPTYKNVDISKETTGKETEEQINTPTPGEIEKEALAALSEELGKNDDEEPLTPKGDQLSDNVKRGETMNDNFGLPKDIDALQSPDTHDVKAHENELKELYEDEVAKQMNRHRTL